MVLNLNFNFLFFWYPVPTGKVGRGRKEGGGKMEGGLPVVLWLSRHEPVPAQLEALEKKLGNYKLRKVCKKLSTAQQAIEIAKKLKADYIIPVLPLTFIEHLIDEAKKNNITVLKAEMKLIHNCTEDPCPEFKEYCDTIQVSKDYDGNIVRRHYRFQKFSVLKAIKIETEEW